MSIYAASHPVGGKFSFIGRKKPEIRKLCSVRGAHDRVNCVEFSSSVVPYFARSLYRRTYPISRDTRRVERPVMCDMVSTNPLFGVPAWHLIDCIIFLSPASLIVSIPLIPYSHYASLLIELIEKSRVTQNSNNFQNIIFMCFLTSHMKRVTTCMCHVL
jgi:hypothetical protein